MQIEVLNNLDSIKDLEEKWSELYDKAQAGPFIHHTWVYENYRCFGTKNIILLAVYGEKSRLIGIFPFAIKTFRIKLLKYRALTHGGSAVTDYSQFLIDPEANSRLMIKRIFSKLIELQPGRWDIYKIDNLCDDDDISNLFRYMALTSLYAGVTATEIAPIIRFDHGHQEAKKIANIKRRFKKINNECSITHCYGKDIDDNLMKKFSDLHQLAYPESGFDKQNAQAFYRAIINNKSFQNKVCLSYIKHQENIIAAHFGFMDARTFFYYVPTYDDNYSHYGPGQYLLWNLINMSNEKHQSEFDFLRGSEIYKFNWTNKITTNYTVIGVTQDADFFKKLLINLWLLTKEIPYFKNTVSE